MNGEKRKSFTVGISGASGSGKTSFLNSLCDCIESWEVCLISQDNYYKDISNQKEDTNGVVNFDLPQAFDLDAYIRDIGALQRGEEIRRKEYTFNNPEHTPQHLLIRAAPIIIVEGLFLFHEDRLKELFDLKVFIEVQDHIKLKRRIIRDNEERGYDLNDVLYRYEHHVFPSYQRYIAPYRDKADVIIPNNTNFDQGLDVLVAFLKDKLRTLTKAPH